MARGSRLINHNW